MRRYAVSSGSSEVAKKWSTFDVLLRPEFEEGPKIFFGHLLIDTASDLLAKFG